MFIFIEYFWIVFRVCTFRCVRDLQKKNYHKKVCKMGWKSLLHGKIYLYLSVKYISCVYLKNTLLH